MLQRCPIQDLLHIFFLSPAKSVHLWVTTNFCFILTKCEVLVLGRIFVFSPKVSIVWGNMHLLPTKYHMVFHTNTLLMATFMIRGNNAIQTKHTCF